MVQGAEDGGAKGVGVRRREASERGEDGVDGAGCVGVESAGL